MPFVPDTTILIQFAVASVILAITPGPDMTLFVSRTLSQGRAAGFASMAGALTGTVVHTTLVVVGVSALIVASPAAFLALKIFGAGYLVFLAYQAIRYGSAFSPEPAIIPANGHLEPVDAAASPSAFSAGPILTPRDDTSCVSNGFVSIAIS